MATLDDVEFAENPDRACPCILLLDTSGSMDGESINALNQGLKAFQKDVQKDRVASRRVEVAIVTFGNGGVQVEQEFVKVKFFEPPVLSAGGSTPMGEAINKALDLLRERKNLLTANGVPYYRPWLFLITDGAPTDIWKTAAERVHREEQEKGIAFFAVGVGEADMNVLSQIALRTPLKLQRLAFTELFLWLSESQRRVSGTDKVTDSVSLPVPQGWAEI